MHLPGPAAMISVTDNTLKAIGVLFPVSEQQLVREYIESDCSSNVPGCQDWSAGQLERIWFAVLKLSEGEFIKLDSAIELANTDYRDLLMSTDFGHDVQAHEKWFAQLMGERSE